MFVSKVLNISLALLGCEVALQNALRMLKSTQIWSSRNFCICGSHLSIPTTCCSASEVFSRDATCADANLNEMMSTDNKTGIDGNALTSTMRNLRNCEQCHRRRTTHSVRGCYGTVALIRLNNSTAHCRMNAVKPSESTILALTAYSYRFIPDVAILNGASRFLGTSVTNRQIAHLSSL
jgi:hypothetical protein